MPILACCNLWECNLYGIFNLKKNMLLKVSTYYKYTEIVIQCAKQIMKMEWLTFLNLLRVWGAALDRGNIRASHPNCPGFESRWTQKLFEKFGWSKNLPGDLRLAGTRFRRPRTEPSTTCRRVPRTPIRRSGAPRQPRTRLWSCRPRSSSCRRSISCCSGSFRYFYWPPKHGLAKF